MIYLTSREGVWVRYLGFFDDVVQLTAVQLCLRSYASSLTLHRRQIAFVDSHSDETGLFFCTLMIKSDGDVNGGFIPPGSRLGECK